jgi:CRP/FNR family transcriptional regulator, cyclic AMP receptor protein
MRKANDLIDGSPMAKQRRAFNSKTFLTTVGTGRKLVLFSKGQTIYAQGDAADALFVIQKGLVQLSVKSQAGRETTLDIFSDEDLVGKDSLSGLSSRMASATAITDCSLLQIEKQVMMLALKRHVKLANVFWTYLLARNIRYQQDLVDQHSNRSEKRLARILLLLAHYDGCGAPETTVQKLSHGTLAEMVGTTRSRVCFFMNQFKELGFIDYERKGDMLRVHRTLLAFCSKQFPPLEASNSGLLSCTFGFLEKGAQSWPPSEQLRDSANSIPRHSFPL